MNINMKKKFNLFFVLQFNFFEIGNSITLYNNKKLDPLFNM